MKTDPSPCRLALLSALAVVSLAVAPASAAPRAHTATLLPRILIWDNDNGVTLCDPDIAATACVPVGTEVGLVRAVIDNGGDPWLVTQLPSDLSTYDAVYITLGWATASGPAGQISTADQQTLVNYIEDGHPVFLEGNDFAHDYQGTTLLSLFGAVYNGDGSTEGNVSQLIGRPGTFAQGMTFGYPFGSAADFSVDDVLPGGSNPGVILFDDQNGPGKAMSSPSEGGAPRGKGRGDGGPATQSVTRGRTVLFTTSFGAMPDGLPPSTKDLLMGRVLVNFGLLVTPAPPATWGSIKALFNH